MSSVMNAARIVRRAAIVLLGMGLTACMGNIRNGTPAAVYDFGVPATQPPTDKVWPGLALEVKPPPWFDSLYVNYRLDYDDPLRPREYAGSRWAGAPDVLLAQRLRQQLGSSNAGNGASACLLRVELQAFTQVFDTPRSSHGLLQARVSVVDRKRLPLAERPMRIEQRAPTEDARGGVVALVAASDTFGQQLAAWLAELDENGRLGNCRANP